MKKPSARALEALNTLDREVIEWLSSSFEQYVNEHIDAQTDHLQGRMAGKCEVLRDILNSIKGARSALERIRSTPTPGNWSA